MNPCLYFSTSPKPARKHAPVGTPPSGKLRKLGDFTTDGNLNANASKPFRKPRPGYAAPATSPPTQPRPVASGVLEVSGHPLLGKSLDFSGVLAGFGMSRAEGEAFLGTSTELKARLEYLEEQKLAIQRRADYYQTKCGDLGAQLGLCVNEFRVEQERLSEDGMNCQQTLALVEADYARLSSELVASNAENARLTEACLCMQRSLSLSKEECVRLSGEKVGAQQGFAMAAQENARLVSRLDTITSFVKGPRSPKGPGFDSTGTHGIGRDLVARFNESGEENRKLRVKLAATEADLVAARRKADYLETTTHAAEGRVWPTVIPLLRHNTGGV